jgi:hypothetical protein
MYARSCSHIVLGTDDNVLAALVLLDCDTSPHGSLGSMNHCIRP